MMNLAANLFNLAVEANWKRLGCSYRDYGSVACYTMLELAIFALVVVFVLVCAWCNWHDARDVMRAREKELGDTEILFLYRLAENDLHGTQNVLWFELMVQCAPEFESAPAEPLED